ncbi:MAG: hypothetical protein ABSG75_15065 [Syntrophales bacterium]|jgi:hypothetical protein
MENPRYAKSGLFRFVMESEQKEIQDIDRELEKDPDFMKKAGLPK